MTNNHLSFIKNKRKSKIDGLLVAELDIFEDNRGQIWTLYNETDWNLRFVEDKISISSRGVIRGLHGDSNTWKLIGCLSGEFFLVIVDARRDSSTYGLIETISLNSANPEIVLVPAGCLNGHQCISEEYIFWYKWSEHYTGQGTQETCRWDDDDLEIEWPIPDPILSNRDLNGKEYRNIIL